MQRKSRTLGLCSRSCPNGVKGDNFASLAQIRSCDCATRHANSNCCRLEDYYSCWQRSPHVCCTKHAHFVEIEQDTACVQGLHVETREGGHGRSGSCRSCRSRPSCCADSGHNPLPDVSDGKCSSERRVWKPGPLRCPPRDGHGGSPANLRGLLPADADAQPKARGSPGPTPIALPPPRRWHPFGLA